MSKHVKDSIPALIGLIILFAFSLVWAWGRKPPERHLSNKIISLSSEELKTVDEAYVKSVKKIPNEVQYGRSWYKFETHPLLVKIFPQVKFYLLFSSVSMPQSSYFKAEYKRKFYSLPFEFNRLLIDNGLEVNNKNIIELAKAFVVIASAELRFAYVPIPKLAETVEREEYTRGLPQITFLEGKRIKEYDKYWAAEMVAQIKCKIGDGDVQTWKFSRPRDGQFGVAQIFINKKYGQAYQIKRVEREKSKGEKGELDTVPEIQIATDNEEIRGH